MLYFQRTLKCMPFFPRHKVLTHLSVQVSLLLENNSFHRLLSNKNIVLQKILLPKQNFFFNIFVAAWGMLFLTRLFDILVSTFCRSDLLVTRRFVADTFWRCNIVNTLYVLYEIGFFLLKTVLYKGYLLETDLYLGVKKVQLLLNSVVFVITVIIVNF